MLQYYNIIKFRYCKITILQCREFTVVHRVEELDKISNELDGNCQKSACSWWSFGGSEGVGERLILIELLRGKHYGDTGPCGMMSYGDFSIHYHAVQEIQHRSASARVWNYNCMVTMGGMSTILRSVLRQPQKRRSRGCF